MDKRTIRKDKENWENLKDFLSYQNDKSNIKQQK